MSEERDQQPTRPRFGTRLQQLLAGKFLIVSIAVHLLFGVGATYYVVQRIQAKRKVTFAAGPPAVNPSQRALEHKVSMAKKKNTMSAPAQAKRITTTGFARVALPEMPTMPNAMEVIPNKMAGLGGVGTGFGAGGGGSGMGTGGGGFGFSLPKVMSDRCTQVGRLQAMRANGGDAKNEEIILKALRWLKGNQNGDGSFGDQHKASMTGLALLAFLGHCERPTSQEFGASVKNAMDYLVNLGAGSKGRLSTGGGNAWVYEHGIATYALAEAYILTKDKKIEPVLHLAIEKIIKGQGEDGGWMYEFSGAQPSDTSVSGWQIQALKAARLTGVRFEGLDESLKSAMDNIMRVRGPKGGFGYRGPEDRWGLTGVGILSLQLGKGERGTPVRQALKFLVDEDTAPPIEYKHAKCNLYAWYYNTQACFQHGGSAWSKWNRHFQKELQENQSDDGSWPETGSTEREGNLHWTGTGTSMDAQVYRTSLCALMLEVYYRYLASSRI